LDESSSRRWLEGSFQPKLSIPADIGFATTIMKETRTPGRKPNPLKILGVIVALHATDSWVKFTFKYINLT
jgi:hypothetical protein